MKLTRYMSFERFEDMCKNGLFLPPASVFLQKDPWEGLTVFHWQNLSDQQRIMDRGKINTALTWIFVSCWHSASEESLAMWKLYADGGVCIETNVGALEKLFQSFWKKNLDVWIMARNVMYLKPGENPPNSVEEATFEFSDPNGEYIQNFAHRFAIGGLSLKHQALQFEKEFRVICDKFKLSESRQLVSCKESKMYIPLIDNFIDRVLVSPGSIESIIKKIENILKESEIKCPVERSAFDFKKFKEQYGEF